MRYARTNEGGSGMAFIIVSVVLAAAVIVGVYFIHQRGQQQASVQPASKSKDQPKSQPVTPPAAASQQPTASKPQSTTDSQIPTSGVSQSSHLPATGPVDTTIQLVAIGLLTTAVVAYVQSRRQQLVVLRLTRDS